MHKSLPWLDQAIDIRGDAYPRLTMCDISETDNEEATMRKLELYLLKRRNLILYRLDRQSAIIDQYVANIFDLYGACE